MGTCLELGCVDLDRACVGEAPFQACGDCVGGTTPHPAEPERCAPPLRCDELSCPEGQVCIPDEGQGAACEPSRCDPGQAWREDTGACVDCFVNCDAGDEGETGNIWPVTLMNSDRCICETQPSYYWDEGGDRAAKPCDADGDGWVRASAQLYFEDDDPALQRNARCAIRVVDRVVLENEHRQQREVRLCEGARPLIALDDPAGCDIPLTLSLYESVRNDAQSQLDLSLGAPAYQQLGRGRRLRAAEVNPLTKACTLAGDYNDNGRSDIAEWHGQPAGALNPTEQIFAQLAYFVELHRARWEPGNQDYAIGRLVISERSRCEPSFPVHYGEAAGEYWRGCARGRDVAFDPTDGDAGPDWGFDFARWSCDAEFGGCAALPPTPRRLAASAEIPAHGLCDLDAPPLDPECQGDSPPWRCVDGGAWRGMSHHSQFRCVLVGDPSQGSEPRIARADFELGRYAFNACNVACPDGDEACAADCDEQGCQASSARPDGAPGAAEPTITCAANGVPAEAAVGFAAVNWSPALEGYERGCVDEWRPRRVQGASDGSEDSIVSLWRGLCPGWTDNPTSVIGQPNQDNFGQLQCGCGNNYGGLACDGGCPSASLLLSQGYDPMNRADGYWMCSGVSSAAWDLSIEGAEPGFSGADPDGDLWTIQGAPTAISGDALCGPEGCELGFAVRPYSAEAAR